jgi:predicted neuraminidase
LYRHYLTEEQIKTMDELKKSNLLLIIFIGLSTLSCTIKVEDKGHDLTTRKFQGIPSLAISPKGQLWTTWYAGITPDEDQNNYVVVASSGDEGLSWTEKFMIDPDCEGPIRAFDPEIWLDPTGKLWLFWAETISHDGANAELWAKTNSNPDEENSKWSDPIRISTGVMMCKPTVISNGEWLFPVSTWRETDNSARIIVSTDQGKTFTLRGACNVPKEIRNYDEHMIVERKDKSLWMLIRVKGGIAESLSMDEGLTWSVPNPSKIEHPSARFFIRRLSSGNLLLVKHGSINEKIGRSHLTAYISKDDGKTWLGGLLLDERNGVSYPDGQQDKHGVIHIAYDYSRTAAREILMATFREDDVINKSTTSSSVSLLMIISKYSELGFDSKKIFLNEAIVKIISQHKDNEVRYTIDGREPTKNSFLYTKPFKVTETTKLKIKEFIPDGSKPRVYEANYIKEKPIDPVGGNINNPGMIFEYFELPKPINSVADLQEYKPTKKGEIEKFVFPYKVENLPELFGLKYSGYIKVPEEDVYTFSTLSNDGSRLYLADKLVVDNDGQHGAYEKVGEIALQKGWHKIELSYFQAGGGQGLKVFWKNSTTKKTEISENILANSNKK